MRPVVLYRASMMPKDEISAAEAAGFFCTHSRMLVKPGDVVVARYSALPFYKEQEEDIKLAGGVMINTLYQHAYIADMRNWYEDLQGMTPETWFRIDEIPHEGSFVLKGKTNSRKEHWKTHMFAQDRQAAIDVCERLLLDGFIGQGGQDIYVRRYVPLVTYARGINDLPITEEYRFFVCNQRVLSWGYYWSSWGDTIHETDSTWTAPTPDQPIFDLVAEATKRIGKRAAFYAIDVARTAEGQPIVIELNDGQMSGLSANQPTHLYSKLYAAITGTE
jgi:hypothetical protein